MIIPKVLRRDVLLMLHSSHMGMTVMKQLARNYVWWPGLDGDIEAMVRLCEACQRNQAMPKKSIPHPWIRTTSPWERLHIDYAGPFGGNMWMIVIDSYSKWIEVVNMKNNTTAPATIQHLRKIFSRFGLPKILVSDNARQLVKSQEFADFCKRNGIQHIPIPSYHPSSNGQCESVVGKFKLAMKRMSTDKANIDSHIPGWLLNYHNTAHSVTGVEPAVLMMNRRLRSPLSLLNPLSSSTVKQQVRETNERIRSEKTLRRFQIGDRVLVRDVLHKRWIKGIVVNTSDKVYEVETTDGKLVSKHIDHVIADTTSQLDWEDESSKTEVQLIPRELVSSREPVQARSQAQVSSSTPVTMATSNAQSTPAPSSLPVSKSRGGIPFITQSPKTASTLYDSGSRIASTLYDSSSRIACTLYDSSSRIACTLYNSGSRTASTLYDSGSKMACTLYGSGSKQPYTLYDSTLLQELSHFINNFENALQEYSRLYTSSGKIYILKE